MINKRFKGALKDTLGLPSDLAQTNHGVPERMAFGRHETFALRYGWLSKGFQAMIEKKVYLNHMKIMLIGQQQRNTNTLDQRRPNMLRIFMPKSSQG